MQGDKRHSVIPYEEGTWFAVPLRNRGFGTGVVVRMKADQLGGICVGYFFGPRSDGLPRFEDVEGLQPRDAVLICQFGDLSLVDHTWPILGTARCWSRKHWPMPAFARTNPLNGRISMVKYSEDDIRHIISEEPANPSDAISMPRDGLYGAGAVEIVLTKLLEQVKKNGKV